MLIGFRIFRQYMLFYLRQEIIEVKNLLEKDIWLGIGAIATVASVFITFYSIEVNDNIVTQSIKDNASNKSPNMQEDVLSSDVLVKEIINIPKHVQSFGSIDNPSVGGAVDPQFLVSGRISLAKDEQHGWVAVKKGQSYWPKEPPINVRSGKWEMTVYEGGVSGNFELVLLAVENETNDRIQKWFYNGLRTGKYPSMMIGDNAIILDQKSMYISGGG